MKAEPFRRRGIAAPSRVRGFTLLEAIVALVVFSLGAFALYGWLSTNVHALQRIGERREAGAAVGAALDLVRRVNPMADERGTREVGDLIVQWDAEPVEPIRRARYQTGVPTAFEAGLYVLDVRVLRDGKEIDRFSVRQVGYRQLGSLEFE